MSKLERKVAVVTGASKGIGAGIATALASAGAEVVEKHSLALTPLGRIGTPADIAKVVAFLASDDSGWLTGEIILASGGLR
jgi:NAD(P)-dependent dehydrogenase (short-subunit alcohol dehydrogenase family)